MSQPQKYKFNLVILGQGAVGKSSLVLRMHSNEFSQEYVPTLQDTFKKTITVNQKLVELDILDTAGQEDFQQLQDYWIEKGHAFLLCYAVNSEESFQEIERLRRKIIEMKDQSATIFLVATKADLDSGRQITVDTIAKYCSEKQMKHVETSARTGLNCAEVFYQVVEQLLIKQDEAEKPKLNQEQGKFFQKRCSLV